MNRLQHEIGGKMKYPLVFFVFFLLSVSSCIVSYDEDDKTEVKVTNLTRVVITINTRLSFFWGIENIETVGIGETKSITVKTDTLIEAKGRDSGIIYDGKYFSWNQYFPSRWTIPDNPDIP